MSEIELTLKKLEKLHKNFFQNLFPVFEEDEEDEPDEEESEDAEEEDDETSDDPEEEDDEDDDDPSEEEGDGEEGGEEDEKEIEKNIQKIKEYSEEINDTLDSLQSETSKILKKFSVTQKRFFDKTEKKINSFPNSVDMKKFVKQKVRLSDVEKADDIALSAKAILTSINSMKMETFLKGTLEKKAHDKIPAFKKALDVEDKYSTLTIEEKKNSYKISVEKKVFKKAFDSNTLTDKWTKKDLQKFTKSLKTVKAANQKLTEKKLQTIFGEKFKYKLKEKPTKEDVLDCAKKLNMVVTLSFCISFTLNCIENLSIACADLELAFKNSPKKIY